jgi:cell division protein FtsB
LAEYLQLLSQLLGKKQIYILIIKDWIQNAMLTGILNYLHQFTACGNIKEMKRLKFSWKYALGILSIVIAAYLVMDFNNRMANLRSLNAQKEQVAAQVTSLEIEKSQLETQIAVATSDAAVAQWAYEDGRMVRPGDNPIIPLPPAESTPVPTPQPVVTRLPVENWQVWLWLFVDD